MALSTITNTNIDNACAAVDAPYGPLTRVGSAPNTSPNSNIQFEVQSALSTNFFISYEDLTNEAILTKILADVHGGTNLNHSAYIAQLGITVMNANIAGMSGPPFTDSEYADIIHAFRFFQFLAGLIPDTAYIEYDENPLTMSDLTTADNGSQEGEVTATLTDGRWLWAAIDWGDGTVEAATISALGVINDTHTYAGADTYTMRVIAIGPGGIVEKRKDQAIA